MTTIDDETWVMSALAALRAPAPPELAVDVLEAVGLADRYAPADSPLGTVHVAWNRRGVSALDVMTDEVAFEEEFQARFHRELRPADEAPAAVVGALAGDPAARRRLRFDLRTLGAFPRAVLEVTARIPQGEVRTYRWVAGEIGHPRAVRAVGTALGHNPIPLLIPCHRVVRSDGTIGNYGLGPAAKRTVLGREGVDVEALEELAAAGVRVVGSATTGVFCVPTCAAARRIREHNVVSFHSAAEAARSGFRPCQRCRPVVVA